MMHLCKGLVLFSYFFLPLDVSAAPTPLPDKEYVLPVEENEIKIMSYNVENLFDAIHDTGKNDFEYLPIGHNQKSNCPDSGAYAESCRETDWTTAKVKLKYRQVERALDAQGPLPDILVLTEVENDRVVGGLTEFLGYDDYVMTKSPDARGIDCAILFMKEKLRPLQFIERELEDAMFPTRNLSTMLFALNENLGGGVLAVFPNHWPSQASPSEARVIAAKELRAFVNDMRTKHKNQTFHYVLTGDFNTIDEDDPNPIEKVLFDGRWKEDLIDVRSLAKSKRHPFLSRMPRGTYYYAPEDAWNELDRFFLNAELNDGEGLEVDALSYRIHAPGFMTKKNEDGDKIPYRYNHNTTAPRLLGYSDHFPVVVKLVYQGE